MAEKGNEISIFHTTDDFKTSLARTYQKQIQNFFGNEKEALRFLSGAVAAVQTNPALLTCSPTSLLNSFVTMASLGLMPSNVSGEAYVLPYKNKNGTVAQFQLGYQGLVTLFYRAGARSIVAEIVYEKDKFEFSNGMVKHSPDVFAEDRGPAIGAYVIVELQAGGKICKVMKKSEIMDIGEAFSKSFKSDFSPWNPENDPQGWMWKKTVLKQAAKLVPKNETIYRAIAEDNEDSIIAERKRLNDARGESKGLVMGNFLNNETKDQEGADAPHQDDVADSIQTEDIKDPTDGPCYP